MLYNTEWIFTTSSTCYCNLGFFYLKILFQKTKRMKRSKNKNKNKSDKMSIVM